MKAFSIFEMRISHCLRIMGLRFQSPGEGVLGRTDMLKDLSARSRKKKFISTPMTTSHEARVSRIGHFITQVYNHKRPHSALEYLTPVEFEQKNLS